MKKIPKYFLLFLLIILAAPLLAEALLGIIFHYKDRDLERMAAHDEPYLYYLFDKADGLNEHGFKTNYPLKKQAGKFRIILTGGSVARGKLPEETIAHYLEKELNERFNTDKIEVINAGMSAYVVEQEFILIQLILQYYEPNMLISLDGYNDLMTFKLNRQFPSGFELPPHNWQDFRVIENNTAKKKFGSRFTYFFKNIARAVRFMQRKEFEKNYDWSLLTEPKLKPVSDTYWQIIGDTHDFCKAKNIAYYSFLQPVRFYQKNEIRNEADLKALTIFYRIMEEGAHYQRYAFTLTSIFSNRPDIYTDDCHVTPEGNQMIAKAMAERIEEEVDAHLDN